MSERFTRVFSLPQNLYAENSPVVIEAGAITKDNSTNKVFAQLKFRNITENRIRAMTVELNCCDTMGNPIGEPVKYQYLDLDIDYQVVFGSKVAITLPESASRSFTVKVTEVIFEDLSAVHLEPSVWESLPEEEYEFLDELLSSDLLEQYQRTYGKECEYKPIAYKDLWRCACGEFSKRGYCCPSCKNTDDLLNVDFDALRKECDERLEAEAKQAEEDRINAEKTKKKLIIASIIATPILIVLIVVGCLSGKYNEVINSNFYETLSESLEAFEESGFDHSIEYDFFDKKISMNLQENGSNSIAIYDPNAEITLEQYTLYLTIDSSNKELTKEAVIKAKELGYDLDVEMNVYLNDDAKTLFMASENGKTTHCILDLQKEKAKVLPLMEKKVQTLLDEKKYYEVLDYIEKNVADSNVDEAYIYLNDSPKFLPAKIYATQMNVYYNSVYLNHKDLENILDNLDTLDENYRDVKQLKKSIRSYYNTIMSFKGKYYKPDDIWDKEFVVVENGTIKRGYISRGIEKTGSTSYYIRLKRENEKFNYFCGSGKLTITGSTLKIEGDTVGWLDGTYTK